MASAAPGQKRLLRRELAAAEDVAAALLKE
jgi:hypothetical protein